MSARCRRQATERVEIGRKRSSGGIREEGEERQKKEGRKGIRSGEGNWTIRVEKVKINIPNPKGKRR